MSHSTSQPQKVVITDYGFENTDLEREVLEPLGYSLETLKAGKGRALIDLVQDADAVITQFAPINAEVIGSMEKCRGIVRYGIGVDNVDLAAAAAKGIPVCNVPDYCIDEVADHTLALLLALSRSPGPSPTEVVKFSPTVIRLRGHREALRSVTWRAFNSRHRPTPSPQERR